MNIKQTVIVSGIALSLGASSAFAVGVNDIIVDASFTTNHANFTMLTATGATVGGANNINMTWDGDAFTSSSDYTGPGSYSNVTAATTTALLGYFWTAHDIQMFVPGTYSFDTTLGGGNNELGTMTATVPAGMLGMHMLFDWNGNLNIDVFIVEALGSGQIFGSGVVRTAANAAACDDGMQVNCLWTGDAVTGYIPGSNTGWMLASQDGNGDGISGIPMTVGGPLAGFNINFNANFDLIADVSDINLVPLPAAAWLFGSGLLGLAGVARCKSK
jgi:hypothetical protein